MADEILQNESPNEDEIWLDPLFMVNEIDFTPYINRKTYTVQRLDAYNTWVDGNWITHRVVARKKVAGSFTMTFTTEAAYDSFKAAIAAVKTEGYCPITIYVSNEKVLVDIDAFVDFTTQLVWTVEEFGSEPVVAAVSVEIEEC